MKQHQLKWSHGEATVLSTAAMLSECQFQLPNGPFTPFARAPWIGTIQDKSVIGHLRELGGDFVGIPFGTGGRYGNAPSEWEPLTQHPATYPIHGPAGDEEWEIVEASPTTITLALDYEEHWPVSRLERTVSGRDGEPCLEFRLRIHARREAEISVGLHPIFRLPDATGDMTLEASFDFGLVHPFQTAKGRPQEFSDLNQVPQGEGFVDLIHPPLNQPNLNVQLCGVRGPVRGIYHKEGAGFELDWDRNSIPSLQIWHTDRGIPGPPWHNQYRGLGLEPIAAAFDLHNDVSTSPNPINQRGHVTAIKLTPKQPCHIWHTIRVFPAGDATNEAKHAQEKGNKLNREKA